MSLCDKIFQLFFIRLSRPGGATVNEIFSIRHVNNCTGYCSLLTGGCRKAISFVLAGLRRPSTTVAYPTSLPY
jgi:hypothetical protein